MPNDPIYLQVRDIFVFCFIVLFYIEENQFLAKWHYFLDFPNGCRGNINSGGEDGFHPVQDIQIHRCKIQGCSPYEF